MKSLNRVAKKCPRAIAIAGCLMGIVSVASCANKAGDDVKCPTCNNTTELLVGTRCVPIAEVEKCGPDGHLHGSECHCFSGQKLTSIGGKDYCLQQGCGQPAIDTDALACDEIGRAAEGVTAVSSVAGVDSAQLAIGKVAEVTLPANHESFVHFEADEAGEFLVYAATANVVDAALTEAGTLFEVAIEGANKDCSAVVPEVWGVHAKAAGPVVLRFKAGTTPKVTLVIYESAHAHE